jgi:hypothetical protein
MRVSRIDLLGVKSDIVCIAQKPLEQRSRLVTSLRRKQRVDQPKAA